MPIEKAKEVAEDLLDAKLADPLGGAYVIEALTKTISIKAWKMFQELEAAGGYRKAKADGIIESVLDRETARRNDSASHRRLVLTGTSWYADPNEKVLNEIELSCWAETLSARRGGVMV